MPEPSESIS